MPSDTRRLSALVACASALVTCAGSSLGALDPSNLVVTSGEIQRLDATRFETHSGALRAQLATKGPSSAELRFHFVGPTVEAVPLASGELRRQIGLKLRAQDSCNVIYAMWRIEPNGGLEIALKSNRGLHRHAECGDRGYRTLRPRERRAVADVQPSSDHSLRASLHDHELQVYADGKLSWAGDLPAEAFAFDGPLGVRSDNGVFDVEFRVGDAQRR